MKRILSLCLVLLMSLTLVACGGETSTSVQGDDTSPVESDSAVEESAVEGDLGDYHVRVTGYQLTEDYDGNDAIILDYEFTNNSEEATSAEVSLYFELFQDGVELESAIILDDSYDSDNGFKDIKTGVTLACQCAYVLENTTSPVEVEISEFLGFSDEAVSFQIDLSAAE